MNRRAILVDRLGEADAAHLSGIAGGTRLDVPLRTTAPPTGGRNGFARLERLVGQTLAIRLVVHFGGARVYVPRLDVARPVDVRAVIRLTKRGWSAARIARKLECSDRTVHAIRTRTNPPTNRETNP